VRHVGLAHADLAGDVNLTPAQREQAEYLFTAGPSLGSPHAGSVSEKARRSSAATLLGHIEGVLVVSPQEQVLRVHAWGVVAAVAYLKAFGDRSHQELVGEPMGSSGPVLDAQLTITTGLEAGTSPEPTGLGLLDLLPEAFNGVSSRRHGGRISL
jgi:hypothetical protein